MKYKILIAYSLITTLSTFAQVVQDTLNDDTLEEMVISGTMKPVLRSESLVPVEVYTPTFFKKNPTSNVFEALQTVNGVRPQVNCSVCIRAIFTSTDWKVLIPLY